MKEKWKAFLVGPSGKGTWLPVKFDGIVLLLLLLCLSS